MNCTENAYLRNSATVGDYRKAYARLGRFTKPTALSMGPIITFEHSTIGRVRVELPKALSKVFGSLVTHPRLIDVDKAFCDDTIDGGETFFCSAHNATWASGKRFSPFRVTHIASGLSLGRDFEDRAEVERLAKMLSEDPSIDWSIIDADHHAPEAREQLIAVRAAADRIGLR